MKTWQYVWRLIRYRPLLYFANTLTAVAFIVSETVPVLIVREYFDLLTGQAPAAFGLWALIAILIMAAAGRIAAIAAAIFTNTTFRFTAGALLRRNLFAAILRRPGAHALPGSPGEAISRFGGDVDEVMEYLSWLAALVGLILVMPVIWSLAEFSLPAAKDLQQAQVTLKALNQLVSSAAQRGEVLFISQRQLLTFGYVQDVPLVADYELLLLSEASISNNRALLEKFYQDLRERRFAMIITGRLNPSYQRPKMDPFAEENNLWVDRITFPILEYYGEEAYFGEQNLQVLVPK
uniref:ABC transporter ATP-binding protein n=1 Tax=Bellilinea caldifistulae TaxID=360411 RepID=A0A7C4L0T4_9CHLR